MDQIQLRLENKDNLPIMVTESACLGGNHTANDSAVNGLQLRWSQNDLTVLNT